MKGTLLQLNVSNGGMPKRPVDHALVTIAGVEGDWQKNRKYHGGEDRAICLFSQEQYDGLRQDHAIDLEPGAVGENFTTVGIELSRLKPGDQLRVGEVEIEITKIRVPCRNLTQWHAKLHKVIEGNSGWMARVTREGTVKPGDVIELI